MAIKGKTLLNILLSIIALSFTIPIVMDRTGSPLEDIYGQSVTRWMIFGIISILSVLLIQLVLFIVRRILKSNLKKGIALRLFGYTQFSIWLLLFSMSVYISWLAIMKPEACVKDENGVSVNPDDCTLLEIRRYITAFFVFSVSLLIEKILLSSVAYQYHKKAFKKRLEETKIGIEYIETLAKARHTGKTIRGMEMAKKVLGESLRNITEKKTKEDWYELATSLNKLLDQENVGSITKADFQRYFSEKQAEKAFEFFNINNQSKIETHEFKERVKIVVQNNENIARNMFDIKDALYRLDWILIFAMLVILIFVFMVIFDLEVRSTVAASLSLVWALNMTLGGAIQRTTDSIVFIFSTHCFDIGDIVLIGFTTNVANARPLMVRRITLLTTEFLTDENKMISFPNSQLSLSNIVNLSRSVHHLQSFTVKFGRKDNLMPRSIERYRQKVKRFLHSNPRDFTGFVRLNPVDLESEEIELKLLIELTSLKYGKYADWRTMVRLIDFLKKNRTE